MLEYIYMHKDSFKLESAEMLQLIVIMSARALTSPDSILFNIRCGGATEKSAGGIVSLAEIIYAVCKFLKMP